MIRPARPCSPACPGWRVTRGAIQRCGVCWSGEVLSPDSGYYRRNPTCLAALNRAKAGANLQPNQPKEVTQ